MNTFINLFSLSHFYFLNFRVLGNLKIKKNPQINLLKEINVVKVSSKQENSKTKKMPSAVTASDFPIKKINFGAHKPNPNGGFNIDIEVGSKSDEILLQTPKMRCPFGISTDKTNPFKKSIDVSFQGETESIKAFRKLIETVDDLVIDYAHKNSKSFFKQEYSREVIKAYYCSNIKFSKKEQYSDSFRSKLLYLKPDESKKRPDGKYLTVFWEKTSGKPIERDETFLDKGDTVSILIKPTMLWIGNKQFGVQWICSQVQITKNVRTNGYAFKKTEESDDEDAEAEAVETAADKISYSGSEEEIEVDA